MKKLNSWILVLFACVTASSAHAGIERIFFLQDVRTNLCFSTAIDENKTSLKVDGTIVYKRLHSVPCDKAVTYTGLKEMEMRYSKKKNICYARLPKENMAPVLPNSKESMVAYKNTQTVVACTEEVKKLTTSK